MNGHTKPKDIDLLPASEFPETRGLYDAVPEADYHAVDGYASSSTLRTILSKSPAHAKARMEEDVEPTKAMRFGTMLHQAILQPNRYRKNYHKDPQCHAETGSGSRCKSAGKVAYQTEDNGVIWFCGRSSHQPDEHSSDPKDYHCGFCGAMPGETCMTASGRYAEPHADRRGKAKTWTVDTYDGTVVLEGEHDAEAVSADEREKVEAMIDAIHNAEKADKLLYQLPGLSEVTALWQHDGTGVLCKSRIDRVVHHEDLGTLAIDYKTTRTAEPGEHGFGKHAMKGRYDVQAAFYLEALANAGLPADHFVIVAQEKTPPFEVVSYVVANSSSLMEKARLDMLDALDTFAECAESGTWPGYTGTEDQILPLEVPHWHYDE